MADTFDAITLDRPYRRALSYADARQEIARVTGRQMDPAVVDIFLSVPENAWEEVRREVERGRQTRRPIAYTAIKKATAAGT